MRLRVLGSSGWYASAQGNTVCALLETEDSYLVLDAGDGIHQLDRYITTNKPIYVFLSHFHLDHIIGLHVFPKFEFEQKVAVVGQPGTKEALRTVWGSPFTLPSNGLSVEVEILEVGEGLSRLPPALEVEAAKLQHTDTSFGYRFVFGDKTLVYGTDTGYCDNLVRLARRADLLITECSLREGMEPDPAWLHLNPELAARTAKEAKARRLLLTHFMPTRYDGYSDRKKAQAAAAGIFPDTVAAYDGLSMEI